MLQPLLLEWWDAADLEEIRAIGADIRMRRSPRCASFWPRSAGPARRSWIIVERDVLYAAPSGLVVTAERRVARM